MSNKFNNPHVKDIKKRLWDIVRWQCGVYRDPLPPPKPPEGFTYPNPELILDTEKPQVTWIGHCTFYIVIDGVHIVTDPMWGKRCSPFKFLGPKRLHAPSIEIEELPAVDFVLVSHDHYDHLDKGSVDRLNRRFPDAKWCVPSGLRRWLERRSVAHVFEHQWWQHSVFKTQKMEITVTATPAQHFSGRGTWHQNNTLWCGFAMDFKRVDKKSKKLYFCGDTGYNPVDFKRIGERFSHFDLSLIPIGTYVPHEFMAPVHIDPEHAVKIHQDVGSYLSVGMHWKTFRLSSEGMDQPPYDLYLSMEEVGLNPHHFRVIDLGQTINW